MQIRTVDFTSPNAPKDFSESLTQTGFAVIKNHPIVWDKVETLYRLWGEFFGSERKHSFQFENKTQDGFMPLETSETAKGNDKKDIKEFFQFYKHGKCPEELRAPMLELHGALSDMASTLLSWAFNQAPLKVQKHFSMPPQEMVKNSEGTMLRVIHYPAFTGSEEPGAIRAAAHEDINLLTLLLAATETGLQAKDSDGKWHNVSCDPETIVVNAADMLQEASGGYYKSTTHRVLNPVNGQAGKPRFSMPLFFHPRPEVRLSEKYTAGEYLEERLREIGIFK